MDEKIFLAKLSMRVVSVTATGLQAIWWSDFTTSIQFADFLVKIGLFLCHNFEDSNNTVLSVYVSSQCFMSLPPPPISENVITFFDLLSRFLNSKFVLTILGSK